MTGFIGSRRHLPGRGRSERARRRGFGLVLLAAAASIALAACTGSIPAPGTLYLIDTPTLPPAATATATPPPTLAPTPTPTPTPTSTPAPVACTVSNLQVTITDAGGGIYWQGGGDQKLAAIAVKNNGAVACTVKAKNQVLLLNGDDSVLILGKGAPTSASLTLAPGGTLRTQVQTGNFCDGPAIVAPV